MIKVMVMMVCPLNGGFHFSRKHLFFENREMKETVVGGWKG
jgi:hypothetical protein